MYTLIANKNVRLWLNNELDKYSIMPRDKYVEKLYKHEKLVIMLYTTNTLTINGEYKDRIYDKIIEICGESSYIGFDEVGVGDFFGPTVYCSVAFNEKMRNILKKYKIAVKDSKKFGNDDIINIYNLLKDKVDYNLEILYDKDIENYYIDKKLNSIEQKLCAHNRNFNKYSKEVKNKSKIIVDLFTTENNFHKSSSSLKLIWPDDIVLETKADSKFLCVGVASMIARGVFLEEIKKIEREFLINIPLGTNERAVETARLIIEKYSKDKLSEFCKTSFKTFKEL